eukprot:scaffold6007_cov63-Phaeocystis_antarctica.AAC.3
MVASPLKALARSSEPLRSALARPAPFSLILFPWNVASSKSPYDRCAPLRSSSLVSSPSVVRLHAIGQFLSPAGRNLSIATVQGGAGGDEGGGGEGGGEGEGGGGLGEGGGEGLGGGGEGGGGEGGGGGGGGACGSSEGMPGGSKGDGDSGGDEGGGLGGDGGCGGCGGEGGGFGLSSSSRRWL